MAGRDPKYAPRTFSFQETLARMREQAAASESLQKKIADLASTEAEATSVTERNVASRLGAADAINVQADALKAIQTLLANEISLVNAATRSYEGLALSVGAASRAEGQRAAAAVSGQRLLPAYVSDPSLLPARRPPELPPSSFGFGGGQRQPVGLLPQYTNLYGGASRRIEERAAAAGPFFAGGVGSPLAASTEQYSKAERDLVGLNTRLKQSLGGGVDATRAFNQSLAESVAASNNLSRHGALSTEFISSFVRGETTIKEFGNAVTQTVGKFAGWAVAGAAVYGAFELIKHGFEGASQASTGLAQLERASSVFPSFNKREALEGFRQVSQRTNVSVGEAAEAQFYAVRAGFHTQPESLKAGETALLAKKLDEVPIQQAALGLGALHVAFGLNADAIRGVFNELDVGQLRFNARLNQTLPQTARAASAFASAGGTVQQLVRQIVEVVGITGGGGGQGGGNPATFFLREAASNLRRPQSEAVLTKFGFKPEYAQEHVGEFNEQLQKKVAEGAYSQSQIRELANALGGGGAQGGRYGVALLNALRLRPELPEALAHAGNSAQEDLNHKLSQFNEQTSAIGKSLERLGLEVGAAGLIQAAAGAVTAVRLVAEALEKLGKPLGAIGEAVSSVPGGGLGLAAILGATAGQRFLRSERGLGLTARVSELPGFGSLQSDSRAELRRLTRTSTEGTRILEERYAREASRNSQLGTNLLEAKNAEEGYLASPRGRAFLAQRPDSLISGTEEERTAALRLNEEGAGYIRARESAEARLAGSNEKLANQRELIANREAAKRDLTGGPGTSQERLERARARGEVRAEAGRPNEPLLDYSGATGAEATARGRLEQNANQLNLFGEAAAAGAAETKAAAAETQTGFAAVQKASLSLAESLRLLGAESLGAIGGNDTAGLKAALKDTTRAGGSLLGSAYAPLGAQLGKVGERLFPALTSAFIGTLVAEIAGSAAGAIGGKGAQRAVSGIGTAGAIGLGLGTLTGNPVLGLGLGLGYGALEQLLPGPKTRKELETRPFAESLPVVGKLVEAYRKIPSIFAPGNYFLRHEEEGKEAEFIAARNKRNEQAAQAKLAIKQLGGGSNADALEAATGFQELREEAAKGEGKDEKAKAAEVERRNRTLAANAKFYAGTGKAVGLQKEIAAETATSLAAVVLKPDQIADSIGNVEKALEAGIGTAGATATRRIKNARTAKGVGDALKQYQEEAQPSREIVKLTEGALSGKEKDKEDEIRSKIITQVQAVKAGETDRARKIGEEIKNEKGNLDYVKKRRKQLAEIAPKINEQIEEKEQEIEEAAAGAAEKAVANQNVVNTARAGKNELERRKLQEGELEEVRKRVEPHLKGAALQDFRRRQQAQRIALAQKADQERVEGTEESGQEQLAKLPFYATASQQAGVKLKTAQAVAKQVAEGAKSGAFGLKEVVESKVKLLEAQKAVAQANENEAAELDKLRTGLRQAELAGNRLGAAREGLALAQRNLGRAKNAEQRFKAQTEIVDQRNQIQADEQQRVQDQTALEESRTTDPLAQARIKLRGDRRLLAKATPDERIRLEAQRNRDQQALVSTTVSASEERISFQKTLGKISSQTAIQEYQALLHIHGLTKKERDDILLKIHALQTELTGTTGVYDLSPGKIKLPTAADVHRAIGNYAAPSSLVVADASTKITNHNSISITVHDARDIHKVEDALSRHTGVNKARLKAQGHRGT